MSLETMEQPVIETASTVDWKLEGNFLLSSDLRNRAQVVLETTPFPTTRTEAWKYTRVAKIKNGSFAIRPATTAASFRMVKNSLCLVFVNGHFSPELSDRNFPQGVKILPLSAMDEAERHVLGNNLPLDGDVFNAFNTAYTTDGAYIHISAKMIIEPTIELIHVTTGSNVLSNIRNVVVAEAFSRAHIVQQFVSDNAQQCFTNSITEIRVAANASLTFDKLQLEDASCLQVATEQVSQEKDATFTINTITLDGGWVRNNLNIAVNGQNATTNLNGAYILNGSQHVDNHTTVDHKVAHCVSNELYKGVIDGKATAVFNGKVFVRKNAQKINAFQSNGNVLLSLDATVNSKPELEIYADDVKCSHGSTTGQLDEDAVFYLRARGIGEQAARQLMIGAFVGEVLEKIENDAVAEKINAVLTQRFKWMN